MHNTIVIIDTLDCILPTNTDHSLYTNGTVDAERDIRLLIDNCYALDKIRTNNNILINILDDIRVTDTREQRLILNILDKYFTRNPMTLVDKHKFIKNAITDKRIENVIVISNGRMVTNTNHNNNSHHIVSNGYISYDILNKILEIDTN